MTLKKKLKIITQREGNKSITLFIYLAFNTGLVTVIMCLFTYSVAIVIYLQWSLNYRP